MYRRGCRLCRGRGAPWLKLLLWRLSVAVVVGAAVVVVASVVGACVVASVLMRVVVIVAVVAVVEVAASSVAVAVGAPTIVVVGGMAVGDSVDVVFVPAPAIRTYPLLPLTVGAATIGLPPNRRIEDTGRVDQVLKAVFFFFFFILRRMGKNKL